MKSSQRYNELSALTDMLKSFHAHAIKLFKLLTGLQRTGLLSLHRGNDHFGVAA